MKKKTVKKLKLKESVKNGILAVVACYAVLVVVMIAYTNRVNAINNNPEGYTNNGHAQSVEVNFVR